MFSFRRVATVMVSFHSERNPKTFTLYCYRLDCVSLQVHKPQSYPNGSECAHIYRKLIKLISSFREGLVRREIETQQQVWRKDRGIRTRWVCTSQGEGLGTESSPQPWQSWPWPLGLQTCSAEFHLWCFAAALPWVARWPKRRMLTLMCPPWSQGNRHSMTPAKFFFITLFSFFLCLLMTKSYYITLIVTTHHTNQVDFELVAILCFYLSNTWDYRRASPC